MRVKETIEKAAERIYPVNIVSDGYDTNMLCRIGFYIGYELSQERSYSEEELFSFLLEYQSNYAYANNETGLRFWFNKYKKK